MLTNKHYTVLSTSFKYMSGLLVTELSGPALGQLAIGWCSRVQLGSKPWCIWCSWQLGWFLFGDHWSFSLMFSMNSLNSLQQKDSNPTHLLCERPACYHSASTTHVRDKIFKFSSIHASVIYLIPWIRWIQWKFLSFRKNSIESSITR